MINLLVQAQEHPIKPENITAKLLFDVAQQVVKLCQKKDGWLPFSAEEVQGITAFQLRNMHGLVEIDGKFHISHDFVSHMFRFATALPHRDSEVLLIRAHIFKLRAAFFQIWYTIPEAIVTWTYVATGIVMGWLSSKSLGTVITTALFWPVADYKGIALLMWLLLIVGLMFMLLNQRKNITLI